MEPAIYDLLSRLKEAGPVTQVLLHDNMRAWLLTQPDDIAAAASDRRLTSDVTQLVGDEHGKTAGSNEIRSTVKFSLMAMDPPAHTRLRRLMTNSFTSDRVKALQHRIGEITGELLARIAPLGNADLVDSLARPLPVKVICELLAIPSRERSYFQHLSGEMLLPPASPEAKERILAGRRDLYQYLRTLIRERSADLGDGVIGSLISAHDDSKMNDNEVVEAAVLLLVAGYETTVSFIGTAALALLQHPDQLAMLRNHPELMPDAVEELLRYDGPLSIGVTRYTTSQVTIAGTRIPAGERVILGFGAANHDQGRFPNPETLDISRSQNSHFAFGYGPHYCLGAPLARLEAQIALGALISRFHDLSLAVPVSRLRWKQAIFRALEELPVSYTPIRWLSSVGALARWRVGALARWRVGAWCRGASPRTSPGR
jgi:cytochrome P450